MKKFLFLALLFEAALGAAAQTPSSAVPTSNIAEQVRGTDSASTGFVAKALHWYDANMNYSAVGILMAVESSFIPFPSEVVIPPAAYVASNPDTKGGMKIWLIVLIGTLGALVGAYINYFLSRWLGRPIVYAFADSRVGHFLRLSKAKIQQAEDYFNKHGKASTLVGRLIPGIRQFISIPAGLAKMNLAAFTFFTFLGACFWNIVLALLGWAAYQAADATVIERYSHVISLALLALLGTGIVVLVLRVIIKNRKNNGRK